jgi:NAD(P)H-dependent FMN reductase
MRAADGIVISTPEYARGCQTPEPLIGSSTDAFIDKPFAAQGGSRSNVAHDTLTVVLETMSGRHIENASATVPLLGTTLTVAGCYQRGCEQPASC